MTYVIDANATIMCPHGGTVQIITSNTRVKVGGGYAVTIADNFIVAGCAFTVPGPKPQPCVKLQWLVPATRVRVNGNFVLLQSSSGLALSAEQLPQGPPNVVVTQVRVKGQ
jgi:hypothetical protein